MVTNSCLYPALLMMDLRKLIKIHIIKREEKEMKGKQRRHRTELGMKLVSEKCACMLLKRAILMNKETFLRFKDITE